MFEDNGKVMAHSNAILAYVAEKYRIGPKDAWGKGRVIEALEAVEEIAMKIFPIRTMTGSDEEKQVARQKFMEPGGAFVHLLKGLCAIKRAENPEGPYLLLPDELTVADFKIYGLIRRWQDPEFSWIPPEFIAEHCKELHELYQAIDELPFVVEYWKVPSSNP